LAVVVSFCPSLYPCSPSNCLLLLFID
jgi:hypothetical protein